MLAVMESIRFSFFVQPSAFRVAPALPDLRRGRFIVILPVKRFLSQRFSVCGNVCIQLVHVRLGRLFNGDRDFLGFICLCLLFLLLG